MHLGRCRHVVGEGWDRPLPSRLDSERTLVLAFGAPAYAHEPRVLSSLRRAFPQSHLLGCSTAGEISGKTVQDQTLALAVARFDRTSLRTAAVPISRGTSFEAGAALGAALASSELRAMLVLSEGLDVNGSRLVEGIRSVVTVPICGGLAADGTRFERTWCIVDGAPRRGFVTAVALYGDSITLGFGCEGGWDRFGPEWKLTRTAANVLYEIENRPALSVYKRYLGDLAAGLPSSALYYPLAIRASRESARSIVRTVLSFSEADGSLTLPAICRKERWVR
jgi:hypothetical protein